MSRCSVELPWRFRITHRNASNRHEKTTSALTDGKYVTSSLNFSHALAGKAKISRRRATNYANEREKDAPAGRVISLVHHQTRFDVAPVIECHELTLAQRESAGGAIITIYSPD